MQFVVVLESAIASVDAKTTTVAGFDQIRLSGSSVRRCDSVQNIPASPKVPALRIWLTIWAAISLVVVIHKVVPPHKPNR